ncbi:MAG TPA: hypothetical protein VKK31_10805 [Thermoanaerobaculia bacterium]|nr:hypothetical protein [Thermoanaerobaculia bacterium]
MSADEEKDLENQFQDYIDAFESAEARPLSFVLPQAGVALPSPDELDDSQLSDKLWEVINALALHGAFLHNTNHLSDRELYTELWTEILPEPTVLMPENLAFGHHIDMVGSGSEDDTNLYMKYYADEEWRRKWLEEWPDDRLPEPEDPPYDRDRFLPQREFREEGPVM